VGGPLLFAIAVSVAAAADQSAADLERIAQSPYEIDRYVRQAQPSDWKPLAQALHLRRDWVLPPCDPRPGALRDCASELIAIAEPPQVILLLRHEPSMLEVYFRFVQVSGSERWRLTGEYEPFVKYFAPTHKVVMIGDRPHLFVTAQGNAGTCMSSHREEWIDLTQPDMEPIFARTVKGDRCNSSIPDRAVESTVTAVRVQPEPRIDVSYSVRFSVELDNGEQIDVGRRQDIVVYVRRGKEYQADAARSTLTQKQIEDLYENLESDPLPQEYVHYAFGRLREIASGAPGPETRWLTAFLRKCPPTDDTRTLLNLLHVPQRK